MALKSKGRGQEVVKRLILGGVGENKKRGKQIANLHIEYFKIVIFKTCSLNDMLKAMKAFKGCKI